MLVTHKLHIDLTKYGCQPVVAAVQGEANTRQLAISLFSNSIAWAIPDGATAAVAFLKPDGTRGLYDKLPNGAPATTLSGNTVNAILAHQALTCAGIVLASIVFYDADGDTLATFPFKITVEKNPAAGEQISNDYYNPSIFDLDAAVKELEKQVEELKAGGGNTDSSPNVDLTGYATEQFVREGFQPKGEYLTKVPEGYARVEDIPTKPEDIGALPSTYVPPNQTAQQVGADPVGTAASAVSQHNTSDDAHNDLRLLIEGLTTRLNSLANSDDTTLDQMAEVVAYIKANRDLIDQITTGKVSVSDIVNNLTTNVSNKPLSAAQGVALKALIDALTSGKLDATALPTAINTALAQAKASGEFDGDPGDTPRFAVIGVEGGTKVVITTGSNELQFTIWNGKIPVKGVDYFTAADQEAIVQQVIAALGTPVFGTVDLNKVITLNTDHLVDGTYTLGYEDENGQFVELCTLEKGGGITNLIPLSINADGTLYKGANGEAGYKVGYRLSTSNGTESAQAGYACTGFMPVKSGDTIYGSAGALTASNTSYANIVFYNSKFEKIWGNNMGSMANIPSITINADNSFAFEVVNNNYVSVDVVANVAYFRIGSQGLCNGDVIITTNEPIV